MPDLRFFRKLIIFVILIVVILNVTEKAIAISPPPLVYPSNNGNVGGSSITFCWNDVYGATKYWYQLSHSADFYDTIVDRNDIPPQTCLTVFGFFLDDGTRYYWRVAAYSGGWSSFSNPWSVVNGPTPSPPDVPTLISPSNNSYVLNTTIQFQWNQSARAQNYFLQLATDVGFTSVVYGDSDDDWVGNYTGISLSGFLNIGQKYYWRVKAKNSFGETTYCNPRNFINGTSINFMSLVGYGIGSIGDQDHIDVGYYNYLYYLYDVSRRQNQGGHNHSGQMNDNAGIITRYYNSPLISMQDNDNYWGDSEQKPGVDAQVYTGKVYDYLLDIFDLNGFDGLGSSMLNIVEDTTIPNEAQWDHYKVKFGIGIGQLSYSAALDIVAHEWAHAVSGRGPSSRGTGLKLIDESGALNEAFSDWMGVAVEHYYGEYNWTSGEGIYTNPYRADRDLLNPHNYNHPDYYQGTFWSYPCGGDPYINAGVPNKMFHLLSMGGVHYGSAVGGISVDKAIKIAFEANMKYWQKDATFLDARQGMINSAEELYGVDSFEAYQVKNAWAAVGVGQKTPEVIVNPNTLVDFDSVGVGGQSSPVNVTISNWGSLDLTVSGMTLTDTENFTLTGNMTPIIAPGGNATVNVTFNPTSQGGHNAVLTITSNDVDNPTVDISLSGNGIPAPHIVILPTNLNFESVGVSYNSSKSITISNSGTLDLSLSVSLLNQTQYSLIGDIPQFVRPNESASITVDFHPQLVGNFPSEIIIYSDDPNSPHSIPLEGMGVLWPRISVSPTDYNFGDVIVGYFLTTDITISNLGLADLNISSISLFETTNFSIVGNIPQTILPNSSGNITVKFAPSSGGILSSTLTINSNDPSSPNSISLTGNGIVIPQDLVLTNSTITGTEEFKALNSISAGPSFTIEPSADVRFRAGNIIYLRPGFWAKQGSKFRSYIQPF